MKTKEQNFTPVSTVVCCHILLLSTESTDKSKYVYILYIWFDLIYLITFAGVQSAGLDFGVLIYNQMWQMTSLESDISWPWSSA